MGFVALAFVLLIQVTEYTYTSEVLRRLNAKPQSQQFIEPDEILKDNDSHTFDLFVLIDEDKNSLLDERELIIALKKETLFSDDLLIKYDSDMDGMISLNEFLVKELNTTGNTGDEDSFDLLESQTFNSIVILFEDYGLIGGLVALTILFAGIRYSINS